MRGCHVAIAAWLGACVASCTAVDPFACESDLPCRAGGIDGRCVDGWCAAPSEDCASGFRYDASAGDDVADRCVPGDSGCVGSRCLEDACVAAVATGTRHTCALDDEGNVWCWGGNTNGQLGLGDEAPRTSVSTPTRALLGTASQLDAGATHTCAVADGRVWCWGGGQNGRLGQGEADRDDHRSPVPVEVQGQPTFVQVVARQHSCARTERGDVWCWGANETYGRIGNDSTADVFTPIAVSLAPAERIAASGVHTCAWLGGGDIRCWGSNAAGEIGPNAPNPSRTPQPAVEQEAYVNHVCTGDHFTCTLGADAVVRCWGANGRGQLAALDSSASGPLRVELPEPALGIACGSSHACARTEDGVYCWGSPASGTLGDAEGLRTSRTPVRVQELGATIDLAAGESHTCAITTANRLYCWGNGQYGRLGNGSDGDATAPVRVSVPCTEP